MACKRSGVRIPVPPPAFVRRSSANSALAGHPLRGTFYYVYVLVSLKQPDRHSTGWTEDLDERLKALYAGRTALR